MSCFWHVLLRILVSYAVSVHVTCHSCSTQCFARMFVRIFVAALFRRIAMCVEKMSARKSSARESRHTHDSSRGTYMKASRIHCSFLQTDWCMQRRWIFVRILQECRITLTNGVAAHISAAHTWMSCTPAANMYARGLTLDFHMQRVAVCPGVLQCVAELTLEFYVQCVVSCCIMF